MTLRLKLDCPFCGNALFTLWPDWGFWHCKPCGFYAKLATVKHKPHKKTLMAVMA